MARRPILLVTVYTNTLYMSICQFYHLSDLHFERRVACVLRSSAVTGHHGAALGARASAGIPITVLTQQQQEKLTQQIFGEIRHFYQMEHPCPSSTLALNAQVNQDSGDLIKGINKYEEHMHYSKPNDIHTITTYLTIYTIQTV